MLTTPVWTRSLMMSFGIRTLSFGISTSFWSCVMHREFRAWWDNPPLILSIYMIIICGILYNRIAGVVVTFSPSKREPRVRFPCNSASFCTFETVEMLYSTRRIWFCGRRFIWSRFELITLRGFKYPGLGCLHASIVRKVNRRCVLDALLNRGYSRDRPWMRDNQDWRWRAACAT
jgi:hypothetical protein